MKLSKLDEWEHPATFDRPHVKGEPRRLCVILTIGSWDFGLLTDAPGGYRFFDVYAGRWGWQLDTEPT